MSLWLIVPVRSLVAGKSRLGRTLTAAQRRSLNEQMLNHVLGAASRYAGAAHTLVISACEEVLDAARTHRAIALVESNAFGVGLNAALRQATHFAIQRKASEVTVMHADLPCLDAQDINTLVEAGRSTEGLAIATDRRCLGTNGLYFPASAKFEFHFGRDSCRLHLKEAEQRGLPTRVLSIPGFAFDLDTAQDLQELMDQGWQIDAGQSARVLAP